MKPQIEFLQDATTAIQRDLKLNFEKIIEGQSHITSEDAQLAFIALATSLGDEVLQKFGYAKLQETGVEPALIREAVESAAIMGMLNTYYKFRHMVKSAQGSEAEGKYLRAGLRMNSLSNPSLGKTRFEMLAFAVSVLNGCETCITAHEKVLLEAQVEEEKIHDLARLASVIKGISALSHASHVF